MKVVERKNMMWYSADRPTTAVVLTAVTDDANKTWAKYTPSGKIELSIDNPDAYEAFVLGKTYFIDFSEAPAKEADEK
jgi:hypothetical protein